MKNARTDGALLAGVCAGIGRALNWNVWALRALFVIFLLLKTLWAIVVYAVLALSFHLFGGEWPRRRTSRDSLRSPELATRGQRIAELERRFEELERRD